LNLEQQVLVDLGPRGVMASAALTVRIVQFYGTLETMQRDDAEDPRDVREKVE
jgi:hypothetical protein